jgi:hypothetical protein
MRIKASQASELEASRASFEEELRDKQQALGQLKAMQVAVNT